MSSKSFDDEANKTRKYNGRPDEIDCFHDDTELQVYDFLDKLGVEYMTYCHKAAFTMEECSAVRNELGVPVFKNLFLTNRQQTKFFLLMLPADKPFKTKYLSSQIGCGRLSFASPEMMVKYLHTHPGAVSPMGLIFDTGIHVRLLVDSDLLDGSSRYACHPCVNTASISLKMDDLFNVIIPATGHDFILVDLKPE